MKRILLIILSLSVFLLAERFKRDSNGIVTDSLTHLQWQDDLELATWKSAIKYCESLDLKGKGWRLPNIKELSSIVDHSAYKPAVSSVFQKILSDNYWSSTTRADNPSKAWTIHFLSGNTEDGGWKAQSRGVFCVRTEQ